MIKWKTAKRLSGSTKCFSIGDEGSTFPRRGHDGWAGPSRSELMKVGKTWALLPIPWQLMGVAGGRNKSVLVPRTSRSGGRMAARERGTCTCRLIRSLRVRDYILSRHSFLTPAENGQIQYWYI